MTKLSSEVDTVMNRINQHFNELQAEMSGLSEMLHEGGYHAHSAAIAAQVNKVDAIHHATFEHYEDIVKVAG